MEEEGLGNSIYSRKETAYFTFGRFQPPTIGHGALIRELSRVSQENNADAYVFVSSTLDKKKNPLTVFQKVSWLKRIFPDVAVRFINTTTCRKSFASVAVVKECKTIFAAIDVLRSAGYKEVTLCVGSDRVSEFVQLLKRFSPEGISMKVLGLGGKRDETATDVTGMSGTKMREAALRNNFPTFSAGVDLPEHSARILMEQVKDGMKGGNIERKRTRKFVKKLNRLTRCNRNVHA